MNKHLQEGIIGIFLVDLKGLAEKAEPIFLWVTTILSFLQLQNNRAKDINTEFIAVNSSFSPDQRRLDYSAFLILTNSETEIQQNNSTQYVGLIDNIPDENTQTNTSQTSELRNR